MKTRYCNGCNKNKLCSEFSPKNSRCKSCKVRETLAWRKKNGWRYTMKAVQRKQFLDEQKQLRLKNRSPSDLISNYKRSDKLNGFPPNDLTKIAVKALINNPCSYCGSNFRIALDRIDNSKGHLLSNCVPACGMCNFVRRDMPYEAWLFIAPTIKLAREKGLFDPWQPRWGNNRPISK